MSNVIHKLKRACDRMDRAYKRGYNKALYSCRHMSRLSSEALDRPLTIRERFTRRCHLLMCEWCRRYDKQLRFLRLNVENYAKCCPDKEAAGRLSDDGRERIRNRIRDGM